MSDGMGDRRARKKAATRALVLQTAQRLFAERGYDAVTIADVANAADVAVQTVFNHFATKEELFFADRASWVGAAAAAVAERPPGQSPEDALRQSLTDTVLTYLGRLADPAHRAMVTTVNETPALRVYERELVEHGRRLLQAALTDAWATMLDREPEDLRRTAALVASMWTTTARAVADEFREPMPAPEEAPARAREAAELVDRVLRGLATTLDTSETLRGRN